MSAAVTLAAVTALTSCGADSDSSTLSTSEAGERYVALVTPVNEAAVALQGTLTADSPRPAEIQQAATRYVDASVHFKEGADDTEWPESVSDDIAFLVSSNGRALDGIRALARVESEPTCSRGLASADQQCPAPCPTRRLPPATSARSSDFPLQARPPPERSAGGGVLHVVGQVGHLRITRHRTGSQAESAQGFVVEEATASTQDQRDKM